MSNQSAGWKIVVTIFAIIGVIAVVACIGMWAMHSSMMGRMGSSNPLGHSMALMCNEMMAVPHA